jgi:hypothetical protein
MVITKKEIKFLRELAKKQREYSQLPIMKTREKFWTDHNDLKADKPPIHIELWTFEGDLLPRGLENLSPLGVSLSQHNGIR